MCEIRVRPGRGGVAARTNLLQVSFHNLWAVVDSKHNVGDTSVGKGLNLVLDHGLVGEFDEGLGEGQGLESRKIAC